MKTPSLRLSSYLFERMLCATKKGRGSPSFLSDLLHIGLAGGRYVGIARHLTDSKDIIQNFRHTTFSYYHIALMTDTGV